MEVGPLSREQLQALAAVGRIQPDDLVWAGGSDHKVPASRTQQSLGFALIPAIQRAATQGAAAVQPASGVNPTGSDPPTADSGGVLKAIVAEISAVAKATINAVRQRILPPDGADRRRLAIGCVVLACAAWLAYSAMREPTVEEQLADLMDKYRQPFISPTPPPPLFIDPDHGGVVGPVDPVPEEEPGDEQPLQAVDDEPPDVDNDNEVNASAGEAEEAAKTIAKFTPLSGQCLGMFECLDSEGYDPRLLGFSPDGKNLAVYYRSKLYRSVPHIRMADVHTGAESARLINARPPIAFNPDGKSLATHFNGRAVLWDLATGKVTRTFGELSEGTGLSVSPGEVSEVGKMVFSADGSTLAVLQVFSEESEAARQARLQGENVHDVVTIWHLATGKRVDLPIEGVNQHRCIALSSDGRQLAAGLADGAINLWDVNSMRLIGSQQRANESVVRLFFMRNDPILVSAFHSGSQTNKPSVVLWDVGDSLRMRVVLDQAAEDERRPGYLLPGIDETVDIRPDTDQKHILTLGSFLQLNTIARWDPKDGRLVEVWEVPTFNHQPPVDISSSLQTVVIGDLEGMQTWDVSAHFDTSSDFKPRAILKHPVRTAAAAYGHDGSQIVSAYGDNFGGGPKTGVALWNAKAIGVQEKPLKHENSRYVLTRMAVSLEKPSAIAYGFQPTNDAADGLLLWNWNALTSQEKTIDCTCTYNAPVALSRDGALGAIVVEANRAPNDTRDYVQLIDFPQSKLQGNLGEPLPRGSVTALAFSGSGAHLAIGPNRGEVYKGQHPIRIRDIATGSDQLIPTNENVGALAFLPGDDRLITIPDEHVGEPYVRIWDIKSGKVTASIPVPLQAQCMSISRDGKFAAVGGYIGDSSHGLRAVSVCDLSSHRLVKLIRWTSIHEPGRFLRDVHSVDFSPDAKTVIAADADAQVTVWDWMTLSTQNAAQLAAPAPKGSAPPLANASDPTNDQPASLEFQGRSLDLWLKSAEIGSSQQRQDACAALGTMASGKPDAVIPVLIRLLDDKDAAVSRSAFEAIRSLGRNAKHAAPKFIEMLKRPLDKCPLQPEIIALLGRMGPAASEAVPTLFDVMLDTSGKYGERGSVSILNQSGAGGTDNIHREAAFQALIAIGQPSVAETVRRVNSETGQDLWLVLKLLGALAKYEETDEALPRLAELLKAGTNQIETPVFTTFHGIVLAVIEKFGGRAGKDSKIPLAICDILVDTQDQGERNSAAETLIAIDPQKDDVLPKLLKAKNDSNPTVRSAVLRVLETIDPFAAAEAKKEQEK